MTTPTLYVHPALLPVASAVTGRSDWPVGDLARLTRLLTADLPAALRAEAVHAWAAAGLPTVPGGSPAVP